MNCLNMIVVILFLGFYLIKRYQCLYVSEVIYLDIIVITGKLCNQFYFLLISDARN